MKLLAGCTGSASEDHRLLTADRTSNGFVHCGDQYTNTQSYTDLAMISIICLQSPLIRLKPVTVIRLDHPLEC